MSVDLPPPTVRGERSRAAELRALRRAHARATALEISDLELAERLRSLGGAVERSIRFTSRRVVDNEGLHALVAAAKRVAALERDLLVTGQARRRTAEEIRVRTRRLRGGAR
jgi:hypothetical protein